MAFQKVNYVDNVTVIGAQNLNDIQNEFDNKLDNDFGAASAGKFLAVGNDGKVTAVSLPSAAGVSF